MAKKRKLTMDGAGERLTRMNVAGIENAAQAKDLLKLLQDISTQSDGLSRRLLRIKQLATESADLAKALDTIPKLVDMVEDLSTGLSDFSHQLGNLATLTHPSNYRLLAEADGVEIPPADDE